MLRLTLGLRHYPAAGRYCLYRDSWQDGLSKLKVFDHSFTKNFQQISGNILNILIVNFHQVNQWLSILVASYIIRFHIIAVLPYIWNERSLPLRTVDMRALALDLTVRATGHLYPPRALSGRLQRGWCCSFFVFDFVALLGTIYPAILRHFHSVVARSFFQQPLSAVSQLSSHCGQRLVVSYWYQRLSSCSRLVSYYHRRLSSCCEGLVGLVVSYLIIASSRSFERPFRGAFGTSRGPERD